MRYFLLIMGILGVFALAPAPAAWAQTPKAFERGMNALLEGNYAEAYCQWKPLARKGHAEAQYNLGWLYANGNGMNVDLERAFFWWKAAASQGHADSQFSLGLAYMTGDRGSRNLERAARWFYLAAKNGHVDARDSLLRLAGNNHIDVLATLPQILSEPWFGWTGQVAGERVNIRSGPGTSNPVVVQATSGQQIRVLGRRGNWLRIQLPPTLREGGSGPRLAWIFHTLLKPVGPNTASL